MADNTSLKLIGGGNIKEGLVPTHFTLWRGPGNNRASKKLPERPPCVNGCRDNILENGSVYTYCSTVTTLIAKSIAFIYLPRVDDPPLIRPGYSGSDPVHNFLINGGWELEPSGNIPWTTGGPGTGPTRSENNENYYRIVYPNFPGEYIYLKVFNSDTTTTTNPKYGFIGPQNKITKVEILNTDGKSGNIIGDSGVADYYAYINKVSRGEVPGFISSYKTCP